MDNKNGESFPGNNRQDDEDLLINGPRENQDEPKDESAELAESKVDWDNLYKDFDVPSDNAEDSSDSDKSTEIVEQKSGAITSREQFLAETTTVFPRSLSCVGNYLPADRVKEINTALREVEYLNEYETIDALKNHGESSSENELLAQRLYDRGLAAGPMTPEEAKKVLEYATDATEEIRDKKVDQILDIMAKIRTGLRMERSWTPSQTRFLDYLTSKVDEYHKGNINTDTIDIRAMFLDSIASGDIRNYRSNDTNLGRVSYADIPYSDEELARKLNVPIQDMSVEELAEYADIDDDNYIFAYGPFTYGDLRKIDELRSVYAKYDSKDDAALYQTRRSVGWSMLPDERLSDKYSKYVTKERDANGKQIVHHYHRIGALNDFRSGSPLGYHHVESGSIDQNLISGYVEKEILEKRRVGAKDMTALATSVGEMVSTVDIDPDVESQKNANAELHRTLRYMSRYIRDAVGMTPQEAKEIYGKALPTSKDFYEEARRRSESWTEQQDKYLNRERSSVFIKMQDWLLQVEADYADLMSIINKSAAAGPNESILNALPKNDINPMPESHNEAQDWNKEDSQFANEPINNPSETEAKAENSDPNFVNQQLGAKAVSLGNGKNFNDNHGE